MKINMELFDLFELKIIINPLTLHVLGKTAKLFKTYFIVIK